MDTQDRSTDDSDRQTTRSSEETLMKERPRESIDFVIQTKFDFEDRSQSAEPERPFGGFDFGFGSAKRASRAFLGLKKEDDEGKKGWYDWVTMHLK
jgi:hypothetical protein